MGSEVINMTNIKIVVVNGRPGSGKTTFEECCRAIMGPFCQMRSTVDKVKSLAFRAGWDGKKTPEARKLLSDLKKLFVEFNDMPFNDIKSHIAYFQSDLERYGVENDKALFLVDSREPEEIQRFKDELGAITVFVQRAEHENEVESNDSDANVDNFEYDYVIENDGTIADLHERAREFVNLIFEEN